MKAIKNYFRLLAEDRERGLAAYFLKPVLALCAGVYGAGVFCVREFYRRGLLKKSKLPVPVISVGNLTWGGAGKTPFVEYLARKTSETRKTPLILTRGYSHDEVEQFRNNLPHVKLGVGKDRRAAAAAVIEKTPVDLAILDDGFQHWGLERDLEIVMVNALNPFGNGFLLPRGILREPLEALKRASVVIIIHANLVGAADLEKLRRKIAEVAPLACMAEAVLVPLFFYRARKRQRVSIDRLENHRVTTFSGVGVPRSFQVLLSQVRIKTIRNFEFPDHHDFSAAELREIKKVSESSSVEEVITTEKDFYRSPKLITEILNPLILATKLRITSGEEMIHDRLFRLLGAASCQPGLSH